MSFVSTAFAPIPLIAFIVVFLASLPNSITDFIPFLVALIVTSFASTNLSPTFSLNSAIFTILSSLFAFLSSIICGIFSSFISVAFSAILSTTFVLNFFAFGVNAPTTLCQKLCFSSLANAVSLLSNNSLSLSSLSFFISTNLSSLSFMISLIAILSFFTDSNFCCSGNVGSLACNCFNSSANFTSFSGSFAAALISLFIFLTSCFHSLYSGVFLFSLIAEESSFCSPILSISMFCHSSCSAIMSR